MFRDYSQKTTTTKFDFNNESTKTSDRKTRRIINHHLERAKSADPSRKTMNETLQTDSVASRVSRLSTNFIDELRSNEHDNEKRQLNTLNERFENYLNKIKNLATLNEKLRRQVDAAYREYIGRGEANAVHPSESQLNALRQQINEHVRAQNLIQIRLQRAEYDTKFYQTNVKLLLAHDQKHNELVPTLKKKCDATRLELAEIKQKFEEREKDLQVS